MKVDTRTVRAQVEAELADEDYSKQIHGRRHTYNLGCRGPLCKRAVRLAMREFLNKKRDANDQIPATTLDTHLAAYQQIYEDDLQSAPEFVAS